MCGIYRAMEYLPQQNRSDFGDEVAEKISAAGKHVIVLGGGDTGADCLGTALRQGALSVHQFELLPRPPESRTADMHWPTWPMILRTSSAHEEGGVRDWSINTLSFSGEGGVVKKLHAIRLEWQQAADGRWTMTEIPGSEFELPCDLCLLALGFVHPEHPGPIEQLGLELDARGNVKTDADYASSVPGVFAAGDMRRGQSLVVWAISEGRRAARAIDHFLMGSSQLG
jgi:glutamate synthase (NADPH/NADH) small chain